MLDLLARHPLLTSDQLGALLDTSHPRVSTLQTGLLRRGFLREVTLDASIVDPTTSRRLRLLELTLAGSRESLRRLGLHSTEAARHHGYLAHSSRVRRRMLRHLAHTLGANQFFVDLALAARHITRAGGDDTLLEWRSAAACARGRCRPDGFGCYRRGDARYGFFLEYDRATERGREYAAKLDAYYRFRDTGAAAGEFATFPTVLVVSTSGCAEELISYQAHLAAERHGGSPLPLLLTTTELVRTTPLPDAGSGLASSDSRDRCTCMPGRLVAGHFPTESPPDFAMSVLPMFR
jgi:Replication-relaxation